MVSFFIGFIFCAAIAWYYDHEQRKRYNGLHANFLQLVNEISIRSSGRTIFKDKKPALVNESSGPMAQRGEHRIMTPSMAEIEAMDRDDADDGSNLSEVDMEHLRRSGVIQ